MTAYTFRTADRVFYSGQRVVFDPPPGVYHPASAQCRCIGAHCTVDRVWTDTHVCLRLTTGVRIIADTSYLFEDQGNENLHKKAQKRRYARRGA